MKDVVDLSGIEWNTNIVREELKLPVVRQVRKVLHVAGQQVVGTNHGVCHPPTSRRTRANRGIPRRRLPVFA